MKFHLAIFLLFTTLVALPTGAVWACGDAGKCQEATLADTDNEQSADPGDPCVENSPCNDCPPDTDGCGHCHCPDCGTAGASQTGFYKNIPVEMPPVPDWLYADRAANFYYNAPNTSAHLRALFQPPRA